MANTTGRNAAPNQDGPSTMFHWKLQALILPSLSNSSSHILSTTGPKHFCHSMILISTDLHSNLCELYHLLAFSPCAPSEKMVSWLLPFHKDHSWSSFFGLEKGQLGILMKLPDAEPGLCSSNVSKKILKVFLAFQSFFIFNLSWFFTFLYNSLNTSSWVSSLFADFPFRVALLMQHYDFVCQILWSLEFWMEWCDWKLVLYKSAGFQWVELIQHVYVMLKHVLHKPGGIDLFHSSHFDMK